MGNEKYVMLGPSTEADKGCYLSRKGGGGATVVQTPKCLVIGIWDKDAQRSDGLCQNAFDCTDNVERMSKFLKESGF